MSVRKIVAVGLMISSLAYAEAPQPSEALADKLNPIKTFSGRFEQRILDIKDKQNAYSKGRVAISKPGKFVWESLKPDHILIIADGEVLWHYDVELEQVSKQALTDALARSPAGLLIDNSHKINDEFDVTYADKSMCVRQAETCFKLTPKAENSEYKEIFLSMREGIFIALTMLDQLDQRIITEFSAIKINEPIEMDTFKFILPNDIDVIETIR